MNAGVGRPGVVTAIGWLFIAVAALTALGGIVGLVSELIMPMPELGPGVRSPVAGGVVDFLTRYVHAIVGVVIAFAALLLISAEQFLKLRAWARCALEVATWLGLVYVIGFGIFWVFNWVKVTPRVGAPDTFTILGAVMGSVVTVVFLVPCVVLIWLLRGAAVRQAMLPRKVG